MTLTHGSLFAGIGGFDEGMRRAGFAVRWQVEKEPFCRAVLRTRFPESELFEDVRDCGKSNLGAVDVLTAGFPCQDLSVAGKRAGLDGARSGLFWETRRIIRELEPRWFVIENVPGLFSSRGGFDFFAVISGLAELGYGLAWRVLNSQFFGVAQRRRRVFIVGCFGKPCPQEVLFESEGGTGDFAESGEARKDIAVPLTSGTGVTGSSAGRRCEDDFNLAFALPSEHRGVGNGWNTNYTATALSSSAGHHGHSSPRGDGSDNIIVQQAISSKWAKGSSGPAGDEHHNLTVVNCLAPVGGGADDNDAQAGHLVAFAENQRGELRLSRISAQLTSGGGKAGQGYPATLSAPADSNGVRDFASLPQGLDSARYRALGNAVTTNVAEWIGRRIVEIAG